MHPRPALPRLPAWLGRWAQRLPSQCAVCRSWPRQPVCEACLTRFGTARARCPGCALPWARSDDGASLCPDCRRDPLPLQACLAGLDYAYPWDGLLTQLKFHRQSHWAQWLARHLLAHGPVVQALGALTPSDLVLPVPLSPQRLAERGFNQAWELARALHRHSGCAARLQADLLLRVRDTPAQSRLTRAQRLRNLEGAFVVDPLRSRALAGRHVLLVDDVMTTGASLSAAALALNAAGARAVSALVVARTP